MKENELVEFLNGIKFIEKTYDVMRIVDPIKKTVLSIKENKVTETDFVCHHFWNKSKICDNCVSTKAFQENEVFIKIEYHQDHIYMVHAIPVTIDGTTVIVELFKDVTNNMTIVKKDNGVEIDIHGIMTNIDNLLLKDSLTGIFNRRFVDERLAVDIINNSIHKSSLSMIMADIDLFKVINDTYGHLAGDFILKEVAEELVKCVRIEKDWVSRYGGEEFLVCLPYTNRESAIEIAERMRKKIENSVYEFEGKKIQLTISFGVHTMVHSEESSIETIVGLADKNLYKAKNSGRNKVIST